MRRFLLVLVFCTVAVAFFGCASDKSAPPPSSPAPQTATPPAPQTATPPAAKPAANNAANELNPVCSLALKSLGGKQFPERKRLVIQLGGNILTLFPNNSTAVINGRNVRLPGRVSFERSVYDVDQKTLSKLVDLLGRPRPKIMIDPGHGGNDIGARGVRNLEKNVNLLQARAIRDALAARGYEVAMTRDKDVAVSLEQRVEMASRYDVLISVHHNAATNTHVDGIETFAPRSDRKMSAESSRLAFMVQNSIVSTLRENDRGTKSGGYKVLESSSNVAILIECGFITTPSGERRIENAKRRTKLAKAVADAVDHFLK
ncbi:MAG: N-acetylmuramoyl-L-alanine amidase [Victivallaceae bacterium]|nr:N-acetylmuramoyl-L-alanine amidase [Victivallaceae bacterium]